ncbi:MAG: hypothetical protein ABR599_05440 [Gemmatimonadota bacterium]
MSGRCAGTLLLLVAAMAAGCDSSAGPEDEDRTVVTGTVLDVLPNTRLFFYDPGLRQVGQPITVDTDGSFGPLVFPEGVFFGAAAAAGATTGELQRFEVAGSQDTLPPLTFDLDPITVPLAVGNRWTYDEILFEPADTLTRSIEIIAQQPGPEQQPVFTVEERRTDPATGEGTTETYFLARDGSGIRKSSDPTIDATDELLLRLPATLQSSWTTLDLETGETVQKRLTGFSCDNDGCRETNDVTLAVEPEGTFLGVSEIHTAGGRVVLTTFSDIGIVDVFVQDDASDEPVLQRRLRSAQLVAPA